MAYIFNFANGQETFVVANGNSDESSALRQALYEVGKEAEDYSKLQDELSECSTLEDLRKFSFYTDVRAYRTKVSLTATKELSDEDYSVICKHAEILKLMM